MYPANTQRCYDVVCLVVNPDQSLIRICTLCHSVIFQGSHHVGNVTYSIFRKLKVRNLGVKGECGAFIKPSKLGKKETQKHQHYLGHAESVS